MRILVLRDSGFKLVGVGLQWGKPLTVLVRDRAGRTLGAMCAFGMNRGLYVAPGISPTYRELLPICEECKENPAQLWCRSHNIYVCAVCVGATAPKHSECHFYSLAVKRAKGLVPANGDEQGPA